MKKTTFPTKQQVSTTSLISTLESQNSVDKAYYYFANVGKNLPHSFLHSSSTKKILSSFMLFPTDEIELNKIIDNLKVDCAMGIDKIPSKFVKRYKNKLISPLMYICNLAFSSGIFLTAFKTALIIPIYKSGDNYRPISFLPSLSKCLKKLINNRLVH